MDFQAAEKMVKEYRVVMRMHNASSEVWERAQFLKEAQRLRDEWKSQTGEDSLHELAFGESD